MAVIDTLKLARRLAAAGMPQPQAEEVSAALGEAMGESLVSREYFDACRTADRQYLDLRLGETEARIRGEVSISEQRLRAEIAETKAEILKWVVGVIGLQTIVILGAVAAFVRLLH